MNRPSHALAAASFTSLAVASFGMSMLLGSGDYDMDWFTIDSGGGVATGDDLTLHGSIGQWDAGIPLSGDDFSLTGGFFAASAPPDVSTPADLVDFEIFFGSLVAGNLDSLRHPDADTMRIDSEYGFTAQEPNIMQLRIVAQTSVINGATFDMRITSRLNNPGGTVSVRFRDWASNDFVQVHTYALGMQEVTEEIEGVAATGRIDQPSGHIETALHHFVIATFTPTGFQSLIDWVEISVR